MTSLDNTYDPRFDELEAEVDYGASWLYREPETPNPLTIQATGWSTGMTKLGEAEFLLGVDCKGDRWSILVGNLVLTKRLIEGLVEEWNDEEDDFVVTETLGRVAPGEFVSLKFIGDAESARGFTYPNFKVVRMPGAERTPGEDKAIIEKQKWAARLAAAEEAVGDEDE